MWAHEQAGRCPDCGTWDWEWDEDETAWYADTWRCRGCEQKDGLQRFVQQEAENKHPSDLDGLQIRLFRTPPEED